MYHDFTQLTRTIYVKRQPNFYPVNSIWPHRTSILEILLVFLKLISITIARRWTCTIQPACEFGIVNVWIRVSTYDSAGTEHSGIFQHHNFIRRSTMLLTTPLSGLRISRTVWHKETRVWHRINYCAILRNYWESFLLASNFNNAVLDLLFVTNLSDHRTELFCLKEAAIQYASNLDVMLWPVSKETLHMLIMLCPSTRNSMSRHELRQTKHHCHPPR